MINRRQLLLGGAAVTAMAAPLKRAFCAQSQVFENRAMLDESLLWITERSAERTCRRLSDAGFNVIIPCVWHGRGTVWPSRYAPWDNHPRARKAYDPGFDPLANLLKVARRFELEVHPWFTVMLRQRDFFSEYYSEGEPRNMFDVHDEDFREFISSLIIEILDNYNVDGIYLDYIRSGTGFFKNRKWRRLYRDATGRNLVRDYRTGRHDPIIRWQEGAVGDIVRRVARRAREINPRAVISMYGTPQRATDLRGRDARTWIAEGLIDVLHAGDYSASPDWERFRRIRDSLARPESMVVLCGNFEKHGKQVVPRAGALVAELIAQSRAIGRSNGVALYLYNQFTDDQAEALRRTVFRVPARTRWHLNR